MKRRQLFEVRNVRRVLLALLVPVLVAALGACGRRGSGGGGEARQPAATTAAAPGQRQDQGPLGVVPMQLAAGPAHVELTALSRTSDTTVTGQFRVHNDGAGELDMASTLFENGPQAIEHDYDYDAAAGIGLLDGLGNKLYMPLWTTDNKCLCSNTSRKVVAPGGSAELYAVFPAPPPEVGRVTVVMPHTVPIQDAPIATGPVRSLAEQTIDPATVSLAPPRILAVGATVEGQEQSTDDSAAERAVRLSSDVLFALNKADLTARASALLDGVARQINQSTGSTVRVDGYTDTSGNDAINQPLSQRRAQAVAQRLRSLVTRQGVGFQVAGHGSKDPVATNSSEEGRRKNRRTTVTFTRPVPKPTTTTPPASGGQSYRWAKGDPAVLGSALFTAPEAKGLKVEVNSLHRDASGAATLVWTLRNTAGGPVDFGVRFNDFGYFTVNNAGSASGVELMDPAGKLRYQPLHTSAHQCLCNDFTRIHAKGEIWPGEAVTYANLYKLPAELRTVDLEIPWGTSPGATVTGLTVN
jgi:outer membrane protein OmpA-like peptidoglycan-associated protein